jgi:hypothetical protein
MTRSFLFIIDDDAGTDAAVRTLYANGANRIGEVFALELEQAAGSLRSAADVEAFCVERGFRREPLSWLPTCDDVAVVRVSSACAAVGAVVLVDDDTRDTLRRWWGC